MTNEKEIWSWLKANSGLCDYSIAAIMGNIEAESAGLPNNVENRCPITDEAYTEAVDNGTYSKWETDAFGYGLCQWTYYTRKRALLAYAKQKGVSIADMEMQLEFLLKELKESYKTVWNSLLTAANIAAPCDRFLHDYENPANADSMASYRNSLANAIYDRNHVDGTAAQSGSDILNALNKMADGISLLKEAFEILCQMQ